MNGILSKYLSKFFIQQWIIGVCRESMESIIRNKTFSPDIKWMPLKPADKFYADPFLHKGKDGLYYIFFEDYSHSEAYGKIGLITLDANLEQAELKILLDTKSHLSYPFIFSENGATYVFPEAAQSGKLSCYSYDAVSKSLNFQKHIIEKPLLDATIVKHDNKYWIFGAMREKEAGYQLHVYYSDNLLGPYTPHRKNPVKSGQSGTRPAGKMIEVDGTLYRPAQNSRYTYGESITINKITALNEDHIDEEFYMKICINNENGHNRGMRGIHTINFIDNMMVVDGTVWRFSLTTKFKQVASKFRKERIQE